MLALFSSLCYSINQSAGRETSPPDKFEKEKPADAEEDKRGETEKAEAGGRRERCKNS